MCKGSITSSHLAQFQHSGRLQMHGAKMTHLYRGHRTLRFQEPARAICLSSSSLLDVFYLATKTEEIDSAAKVGFLC
ncbi:unnamed protein product [Citrullus colocynthis]|uniref:Uncharacterized protein n=1 Tax=Citrullus colocynthis TaxID=252529 RepID=A0ABP0XT46_9ROSI